MKQYIMVIDEGTTGTRSLIFNKDFRIVAQSYEEFTQYTPSEDKVEHNAMEIYEKSVEMCQKAIAQAGIDPADIAAIGITNQRATAVVWDKQTGEPLYNAIVWQDTRTAAQCQAINDGPWGEKARKATGWTVAPVYSSMMLKWFMENVPAIGSKIDAGEALFGTMDTWLIWKLTGGKVHKVSYSNASVMGSYDLHTGKWYQEFLDVNVGNKLTISDEGLNTVIAWKIGDDITYALEGYEDVTGSAVQWLRDGLQCIQTSAETETLARSVDSANGVYFVPALTGLSAPYHDPFARGTIFGITRGTTKAHIVRATLEGIAYRLRDILDVVEKESGVKMEQIRIDGGASKNDFLAQRMADMLVAQVDRPFSVEATSLGAAEMAGLAVGLWQESDFDACLEIKKSFVPEMPAEQRESRYKDWKAAIQRSIGWMNRSV